MTLWHLDHNGIVIKLVTDQINWVLKYYYYHYYFIIILLLLLLRGKVQKSEPHDGEPLLNP